MLPDRPVVFLLHALGGSARAFDGVIAALGDRFEPVAIDLPGFGQAPASLGTDVAAMVDHVESVVRARGAAQWLLVGHSMGGKITSIVASHALAGAPGLFGLMGVVLLAGSPPSPEPMDDDRRATMIGWASTGPLDDAAAREFINTNIGSALSPVDDRLALDDLTHTSREAWLAWLERGSREDWSAAVGTLDLPALIIVGGADGDLGEGGQRATNMNVYPRATLVVQAGAGHLLPLERTQAVADAIEQFWTSTAGVGPAVPPAYARLIASDRVSRRTRAIFARRILSDVGRASAAEGRALTEAQRATLRAVAERAVPQTPPAIDLAARIDAQLAAGKGDGWRFARMPADREAYAAALDALAGFDSLSTEARDQRLAAVAAGEFTARGSTLTAEQMQQWFEDARSDLVRTWLAHPATMARIGFDGFANGGDGPRKQGFQRLATGEREAWEPLMMEVAR